MKRLYRFTSPVLGKGSIGSPVHYWEIILDSPVHAVLRKGSYVLMSNTGKRFQVFQSTTWNRLYRLISPILGIGSRFPSPILGKGCRFPSQVLEKRCRFPSPVLGKRCRFHSPVLGKRSSFPSPILGKGSIGSPVQY